MTAQPDEEPSPLAGTVAILFGPPGSGKGTQSGWIAGNFALAHVSTGDLLRGEVAAGTSLGRQVEPIMASGELVPDDLIVKVIENHMRQEQAGRGILLDGFPRTLPQAEALDAMLERGGNHVGIVLFLDVPEEILRERIEQRGQEEGRADDVAETVHTRFEVYHRETAPVLAYYEDRGVNVRHVDGVGEIAEVQQRIRDAFGSLDGSDGRAA